MGEPHYVVEVDYVHHRTGALIHRERFIDFGEVKPNGRRRPKYACGWIVSAPPDHDWSAA